MLHEINYSKQTCFIDLEQTGRPRIYFIVKHVDAFDLHVSCTKTLE